MSQFDQSFVNRQNAKVAAGQSHNKARLEKGRKLPGAVALKAQAANAAPGVDRERDLHDAIEAHLKSLRWYYVHSRTDKKTTQAKGVVDFIIASPEKFNTPQTYWIEVKKKGGKLTPEQTITKHILQALGHKWACVYSFEEFLTAIEL